MIEICGILHTGKSLPEALILASTNQQYDKRFFIELQVQHMKTTSAEHEQNMFCALSFYVLNEFHEQSVIIFLF